MNLVLASTRKQSPTSTRAARRRPHTRLRLCAAASRPQPAEPNPIAISPVAVLRKVWAVGEPHRRVRAAKPASPATDPQPEPLLGFAFYRQYTEAMLRRYLRLSIDAGRVPSLLGRELFRSRVSSYRMQSFEDVVIFCLDIERCLARLEREEQQLIKRITLQEYTQGEAAVLLNLSLRDVVRKYAAALDRLTSILLETGLMNELKQ
jgi:hypothetical protein